MAACYLSTVPPELVLHIIDACASTRDALAFTATCHAMFRLGRGYVVDRFWADTEPTFPCIEEALIAVRLTQLVADAESRGELPPLRISPGAYSRARRTPVPAELKAVVALGGFATSLEHTFRWNSVVSLLRRTRVSGNFEFEDQARMPEWTTRVHRAIYRTLIAAAALAGAYQEPIFAAKARPDLQFLVPGQSAGTLDTSNCYRGFDFLAQFAVCNTVAAPKADEDVFGPLASWLFASILSDGEARAAMARRFREGTGRALCCAGRQTCPVAHLDGLAHSDAHLVAWELAQMIVVAQLGGREGVKRKAPHAAEAAVARQGRLADCQAVMFGVFNTEDVYMPHTTDGVLRHDHGNPPVVKLSCVPLEAAEQYTDEMDIIHWGSTAAVYCARLKKCSGQPNSGCAADGEHDGYLPPLELKFFDYFARRYLGLQHLSRPVAPRWADIGVLSEVFSHDDVPGRTATPPDYHRVDPHGGFWDGMDIFAKHDPRAPRVFKPWCWDGDHGDGRCRVREGEPTFGLILF